MRWGHKIFALLFCGLQLCTACCFDAGHTDVLEFGSDGRHTLTSHDCGAHCRHKEIPKDNFCPACYRIANSAANTTAVLSPAASFNFTGIVLQYRAFHFSTANCSTTEPKRGPPSPVVI